MTESDSLDDLDDDRDLLITPRYNKYAAAHFPNENGDEPDCHIEQDYDDDWKDVTAAELRGHPREWRLCGHCAGVDKTAEQGDRLADKLHRMDPEDIATDGGGDLPAGTVELRIRAERAHIGGVLSVYGVGVAQFESGVPEDSSALDVLKAVNHAMETEYPSNQRKRDLQRLKSAGYSPDPGIEVELVELDRDQESGGGGDVTITDGGTSEADVNADVDGPADDGPPGSLDEFVEAADQNDTLACRSCGETVHRRYLEDGECIGCRKNPIADGGVPAEHTGVDHIIEMLGEGYSPPIIESDSTIQVSRYCHASVDLRTGDHVVVRKRLTEGAVHAHAQLSGDNDAVCLDEEFAEQTRFGGRSAHAELGEAVLSAATTRMPGVVALLSKDLAYQAPIPIGEPLTGVVYVLEDLGHDRYTCQAKLVDSTKQSIIDGEFVITVEPDSRPSENEGEV